MFGFCNQTQLTVNPFESVRGSGTMYPRRHKLALPCDSRQDSDSRAADQPPPVRTARSPGAVSEWLKGSHWKCGVRETAPRVRIPPAPFVINPIDGFTESPTCAHRPKDRVNRVPRIMRTRGRSQRKIDLRWTSASCPGAYRIADPQRQPPTNASTPLPFVRP